MLALDLEFTFHNRKGQQRRCLFIPFAIAKENTLIMTAFVTLAILTTYIFVRPLDDRTQLNLPIFWLRNRGSDSWICPRFSRIKPEFSGMEPKCIQFHHSSRTAHPQVMPLLSLQRSFRQALLPFWPFPSPPPFKTVSNLWVDCWFFNLSLLYCSYSGNCFMFFVYFLCFVSESKVWEKEMVKTLEAWSNQGRDTNGRAQNIEPGTPMGVFPSQFQLSFWSRQCFS
jgi:hypothetical protein